MVSTDKEIICTNCGNPAIKHDGNPVVVHKSGTYCLDCALRLGFCAPMEYLELHGLGIYHHAEYNDNKIIAYRKWGRGYSKDELELFG